MALILLKRIPLDIVRQIQCTIVGPYIKERKDHKEKMKKTFVLIKLLGDDAIVWLEDYFSERWRQWHHFTHRSAMAYAEEELREGFFREDQERLLAIEAAGSACWK